MEEMVKRDQLVIWVCLDQWAWTALLVQLEIWELLVLEAPQEIKDQLVIEDQEVFQENVNV